MKKNFGKLLALLLFWGYGLVLTAQTSPGQWDNYSGSAATWLNPANMRTTFVYMDLGIANVDMMVRNSFAYLPRNTFLPSMRNMLMGDEWVTFKGKQPNKEYYFKYFDPDFEKKRPVNLYEAVDISLPTFMLTIAGHHAVGFSLRQRAYTSIVKSPWEIPVLATESLSWEPMQHQRFTSEGMRFANMEWSEADLSYAVTFFEDATYKLDAGVTAKLMMGVAGFAGSFNMMDYEVLNKDSLYFYEVDGNVNIAAPVDYSVNFRQDTKNLFTISNSFYRGLGFGGDIGFTLTSKKSSMIPMRVHSACDDTPVNYYWRLGVSLVDIGKINFNNGTLSNHLQGAERWMNLKLFDTVQSVVGMMGMMDSVMGNQVASCTYNSRVGIGLPTALSLQFDLNVVDNFYVNATWIHPVSHLLYHDAVEREPLLSVTPRYENTYFGVAFPVSLYNYSYVTLGTFFRAGPLEFGVNDILSLTGLSNTRGLDFYVAIRLKLSRGNCLFRPFVDACGDKYTHRNNKRK